MSQVLTDTSGLSAKEFLANLDTPIPTPAYTAEPGKIGVIRRNGKVVSYEDEKIRIAMTKAFIACEEDGHAPASSRIHDITSQLTKQITEAFKRRLPNGGVIHIEDIQDQVELALMRTGEHQVARKYVLYREKQRQAREQQAQTQTDQLHVVLDDGSRVPLDTQ